MSSKDGISALHDDLLLKILSQVPTKEAVRTMILSKRWGLVWTMVPKLEYKDTRRERDKSVWCFLGELSLIFPVSQPPPQILLPHCLYTCKTLVKLILSCKALVVDVPHLPYLPSLQSLFLVDVVYKDQDSHVRLLSSCPVLNHLFVMRENGDNVTRFIVKVPSLKRLTYIQNGASSGRYLVLDSPGLSYLKIFDPFGDYLSIQNTPRLDVAVVDVVTTSSSHPNDKFLRSFSSVMFLSLILTEVACCSAINFSRLIEFRLRLYSSECWLEPLMLLLHNSPKLKVLRINSDSMDLRLSWNQPSSVPVCLLSHLEIFEWKTYRGRREEKQFVAYILANSKCLKTVGISRRLSCNIKEKQEMREDLESMYRVSASSQLKFYDHIPWRSREWQ